MKIFLFTFSTLFFLALIGCENNYSKQNALEQSHLCLEIKNELGGLSQERNPYFFLIAENLKNEIKVADSTINTVRRISNEIQEKDSMYKEKLLELKSTHKDSRFIDATIDFIQTNQDLEFKTDLLVKSLLNPKSDKDFEKKLANDVQVAAQKMTEFKSEYKIRESEFHNENNINQMEVDSIVDIINKKKTIANNGYK